MSGRHCAVGVPESTRTRRHVRLAQSSVYVYVYDMPNVMSIVRVCARAPVSVGTFAPESKHITYIIHRAAVRGYTARFGKVDVRLDDRRVYAFRFGRRCASWSSGPAGTSACTAQSSHCSRGTYDIERVARFFGPRSLATSARRTWRGPSLTSHTSRRASSSVRYERHERTS